MSIWHRLYLIVPEALRDWANDQAAFLDADGGEDTFSVPLSADGSFPATHWGASSLIRPETHQAILDELLPLVPSARAYENPPWSWRTALEDAGVQPIAQEL